MFCFVLCDVVCPCLCVNLLFCCLFSSLFGTSDFCRVGFVCLLMGFSRLSRGLLGFPFWRM